MGEKRWNYHRSKISYIPSERNLVASISNWNKVEVNDSILDFVSDWDTARKSRKKGLDILSLGVQYSYDNDTGTDIVKLKDGQNLRLSETSSGFQSLIPMFVHLSYLQKGQYSAKKKKDLISRAEADRLLQILLDNLSLAHLDNGMVDSISNIPYVIERSDGRTSIIHNKEVAKVASTYHNFVSTKRSDIFLEEPENNLFPPTQTQFVEWLISMATDRFRRNSLFVATHSPYVVNCFLERKEMDFQLFLAAPSDQDGRSVIKAASKDELKEMYDYGVDVFFNFETFV